MDFTTRPTLQGTFGMVSSTHWLASQSAMRSLELGGNAFDAAVTAGFVLHLVEPHLNGPGGDMPAIIATAENPSPRVLCGQGPAPAAATVDHFRSEGITEIPGSGPLAAAVPGAVDAWLLLLRDHGTMSLADVLGTAIGYARHGHPLVAAVGSTVERVAEMFERYWPTSADLWFSDGHPPAPGELFRNPAWADTLERLVHEGESAGGNREQRIEGARRAWKEGFVAETIDAFTRRPFRHSGGQVLPGLVTGGDLASFDATWEEPAVLDWHGYQIAKTGLWGQGPTLLQTLQVLDALDDPAAVDPDTSDCIHATVEATKLAMADREAWYGDPPGVPLAALLSTEYARERAALIGNHASAELRPGSPDGRAPRLAAYVTEGGTADAATDPSAGEPTVQDDGATRGDTCHVDVVDRWGNMISATPSGGWLQSSPAIPELGFCLGSRLQMFWLEEGLPSSLAPGRRPRTTLTPTLVHRDDRPVLACGSPGGDQQDQWQLLFLLRHLGQRHLGLGRSLQEAIDEPMWHTTSFPSSFWPRLAEPGVLVIEDRVPAAQRAELESRGHRLQLSGPWSLGRMCAVGRDPETGLLTGAANPRGMQGYAVGR